MDENLSRRAFVVMWHGGTDAQTQAQCNARYKNVICPIIREAGLVPDRLSDGVQLLNDVWQKEFAHRALDSAVLVADVTGCTASVGYEIGLAYALGMPMVCVSETGDLPASAWILAQQIYDLGRDREVIVGFLREYSMRPPLGECRRVAHETLRMLASPGPLPAYTGALFMTGIASMRSWWGDLLRGSHSIVSRTRESRAKRVFERALAVMGRGDTYSTVTNIRFWRVLGDEFLERNRTAVRDRGITIKRVWLLADKDASEKSVRRMLEQHLRVEKDSHGALQNRVMPGDVDQLLQDHGHYAILTRSGVPGAAASVIITPHYDLSRAHSSGLLSRSEIEIIKVELSSDYSASDYSASATDAVALRIHQFELAWGLSVPLRTWLQNLSGQENLGGQAAQP